MQRRFAVCVCACLGATAHAGPQESAILAAMSLSAQPNYSWVATISDDARTYDIAGQTTRGGFTRVRMPVVNSLRRRLGRSATDTQIELIFLGNVACVIETERGWLRPDELRRVDDPNDPIALSTGHSPIGRGGLPEILKVPPSRPDPRENEERRYSNLQLAVSHPHEELGIVVSSHREFVVEGDIASGTLTELGAQLLLVRDGQKDITPLRAAGTFKLWLRGAMVAKYQLRLEGTLVVDTPRGRREVDVHQNADTVVKDIGTTTFDVPAQARMKLTR